MIYDKTKPPNERKVTDIDSVVIKVNKSELLIELNETKNYKKNRETQAVKELREKLLPVLNKNAKGYRVRKGKGFGCKLVIRCLHDWLLSAKWNPHGTNKKRTYSHKP